MYNYIYLLLYHCGIYINLHIFSCVIIFFAIIYVLCMFYYVYFIIYYIVHYATCFFTALAFVGLYSLIITFNNMYEYELENGIIAFYILSILFLMIPFTTGAEIRQHFFKILKNVIFPMPNTQYVHNNEINPNKDNSNCAQSISIGGTGVLNPILSSPKITSKSLSKNITSPSVVNNNNNNNTNNTNNIGTTVAVVPFVEILLADALCSLSKIFKDIGTTIVVLYAFLTGTAVTDYHYHGMLLIAVLASFPFM